MPTNYDDIHMAAAPVDLDAARESRNDMDEGDLTAGRRVVAASKLSGDRVRNSAGEDLGKIEEIMIDAATGQVAYAVLSFGGFLGIGDKLFAVPWRSLTLNTRDHEFILNVDRTLLEKAPGFDRNHWPDMADPSWGSRVDEFYGSGRDEDRF
jgi:sporulation protein YlmC with PRC-barrel domain